MKDAVIFDVDGTLVDTNYLHAVSWWQAFRQHGHTVPMASVHRAVGMGSDKLLDAVLPADRDRSADDAMRSGHTALYAQYWDRLDAFADAGALLRRCASQGSRVVLASSASATEMGALRRALDADDAIDAIASSADVEESKPAPDLVEVALRTADVAAEQAVFVGDAVWDVRACVRAGVPCVGVLSGGTSRAELMDEGAVAVYASPAELLREFDASVLHRTIA
ncbi:HAD-IA family hydrolase [Actinomadura rayongensis]|uniref:HAD-IA family hydrolase n=1 Tax=Actinomadura rayongensis TaxID=1429076 RepID=A0A6I4WI34_9ACTN|nr:HAD-IA family hydrolase [Actinomadura rayongensis]